jgi:hypothetical protein
MNATLPSPPPVTNHAPADPPQQPAATQPAPPAPPEPPGPDPVPAAAPTGWQVPKAHLGATCLVLVHKVSHGVLTKHGPKSMVDATIVELTGPAPGVYEDVQLYNTQLVGQLEELVGQYTLGRFALGQSRGSIPPIVLDPPTDADADAARAWVATHPGRIEELQRIGRMRAETPRPTPQVPQPGPMAGQQWNQSPTQGSVQQQNPYQQQSNPWVQDPSPYPWQQQGQSSNGGQPWQQPAQQFAHPGQDQPPF